MPLCVIDYVAIWGYLLLVPVLAMYLIYYWLYFPSTCQIGSMKLLSLHDNLS